MRKPDFNDFFVRGVELAKAIDILSRWEAMSESEREEVRIALGVDGAKSSPSRRLN